MLKHYFVYEKVEIAEMIMLTVIKVMQFKPKVEQKIFNILDNILNFMNIFMNIYEFNQFCIHFKNFKNKS